MQVKVWNDNTHPFTQVFKEKKISIPAKSYVEMEFYDAYDFLGTYFPVEHDAAGIQDPKSYKMLRVDRGDAVRGIQGKIKKNICIVCAHESPSPEELEAHTKVKHPEQPKLALPEVDDSIESKEMAAQAREDMKREMRAKIEEEIRAELKAQILAEQKTTSKKKAA